MITTINFGPGTTPQAGGSLPAEVRQTYSMTLLMAAEPKLIHAAFMEDRDIPLNGGTTQIMRRWELIAPNTTALTEGVTPGSDIPTVTPVSVAVAQYGRWIPVTDLANWAMIDNPKTQIVARQGEQAARSIDRLARAVITGGTVAQYANGETSRATIAVGDKITAIELKKAKRTLALAFVEKFADGCYVAIISEFTVFDIEAMTEWFTVHSYSQGQSDNLYKGEIGMLFGIRFVVSPEAVIFSGAGAGGIDVYGTVVFGRDAFIKSSISGHSLEHIIKPLGAGDDPLNQRMTLGYKLTFGGTVANQTFAVRIEHSAST